MLDLRSTALMKCINANTIKSQLLHRRSTAEISPCHVHYKNTCNVCRFIAIGPLDVFLIDLISVVITRLMDCCDYIIFELIRRRVIVRHVTSPLSEDQRLKFFERSDAPQAATSPPPLDRWLQYNQTIQIVPHHLHAKNNLKNNLEKFLKKSLKIRNLITFKI